MIPSAKGISYDKKVFCTSLVWILLTMILMKATGGLVMTLIFPIALVACSLRKAVHVLFIILLMISAQVGNGFFFPKNPITFIAIRGTLSIMALMLLFQTGGRRQSALTKPLLGIFVYIGWEILSSALGYAPMVSYLKMVLFAGIYLSYFAVANFVIGNLRVDLLAVRSVVLAFAVLFLVGSICLIPFPDISLMTWENAEQVIEIESLFKGMTTHSQSMGPITSAFGTILLADLVFAVRKFDKLYLLLLATVPILIFKSGSRTALGVFLGGAMTVIWFFMWARGVGARWKLRVMNLVFGLGFFLIVVIMVVPHYRQGVMRFVMKVGGSDEVVRSSDMTFERITASRQGKADECLYHFKQSPLLGNGFQVSESMKYEKRASWASYLSAPIEKGFWILAVLEEGGAGGLILFSGFLLIAFCQLTRRHAFMTASSLVVITLSNFGEFNFFSLTYTGGILWMLVFVSAVLDAQRLRDQMREKAFRAMVMAGQENAYVPSGLG